VSGLDCLRDPGVVKEELRDLTAYLDGLPEEIRASGGFDSYERRVGELSRELMLNTVWQFVREFPEARARIQRSDFTDGVDIHVVLSELARESQQVADATSTRARKLTHVALAASIMSLASLSITSPIPAFAPVSALVAALVELFARWRFGARIRERDRIAMRYAVLRDEISRALGVSQGIHRTSEHYLADVTRIEDVIGAIQAETLERRAPARLRATGQPMPGSSDRGYSDFFTRQIAILQMTRAELAVRANLTVHEATFLIENPEFVPHPDVVRAVRRALMVPEHWPATNYGEEYTKERLAWYMTKGMSVAAATNIEDVTPSARAHALATLERELTIKLDSKK
jgi:hypothetical protein